MEEEKGDIRKKCKKKERNILWEKKGNQRKILLSGIVSYALSVTLFSNSIQYTHIQHISTFLYLSLHVNYISFRQDSIWIHALLSNDRFQIFCFVVRHNENEENKERKEKKQEESSSHSHFFFHSFMHSIFFFIFVTLFTFFFLYFFHFSLMAGYSMCASVFGQVCLWRKLNHIHTYRNWCHFLYVYPFRTRCLPKWAFSFLFLLFFLSPYLSCELFRWIM